jgi:hypothetical protein
LTEQFVYYRTAVENAECSLIAGLDSRFLTLQATQDQFCGFKLTGDGVTLYDLKPVFSAHETIMAQVPQLTAQLKEQMKIPGPDTGSDPRAEGS